MKIPFNRPTTSPNSARYMLSAMAYVSGDGPYTRKCSELLASVLGAPRVLLTTSGTHALELAAMLLKPKRAIVPTFTFTSTANAFLVHGSEIVLTDIDAQTLNMDTDQALSYWDADTVIVPVHYAGVGCEMECLTYTTVIEDNAHGLFGKYRGRWLGTFGDLASLSFHETKNLTMGEGGALVINNPKLIEQAEIIREKGTNRTQFKRGQISKYEWIEAGSSFLPSDLLAAYLWAQLEHWSGIQTRRWAIWHEYWRGLCDWANDIGVCLPYVPTDCQQPHHMFYLLMPDRKSRDEFITHLAQHEVVACFHYIPLHLSPMGQRLGYRAGQFPIAEDIAGRLVRLPFYTDLTQIEQEYVMEKVRGFRQ